MIISISGVPGSGKSTVGKRIAKSLGYEFYSMGAVKRKMALDKEISIEEMTRLCETDPSYDRKVDEYLERLGREEDNLVIDGRLAFHFIPHSLKIFFRADLETCARRRMEDAKSEESYGSVGDALASLKRRMASDTKSYLKHYGVDCYDESHYDQIIDTTDKPIEEVYQEVLLLAKKALERWKDDS